MTQGKYASRPNAWSSETREDTERSFKRYILDASAAFVSEPMADMYRVGLLAQMLDRYDELVKQGLDHDACISRVQYEFRDIPRRMEEEGVARIGHARKSYHWPQLTEKEVADYVKEYSAYQHRKAMGTALCSACAAPLMVATAFVEGFFLYAYGLEDALMMMGLLGLFGMIGMGVYCLVTAAKPKKSEQVKRGEFSLGASLKKKLRELSDLTREKARRRRGKGIAMLVTCPIPIFVGAMFSSIGGDFWPILGVAGLLAMVGAGVYEVVMAKGEVKGVDQLINKAEE